MTITIAPSKWKNRLLKLIYRPFFWSKKYLPISFPTFFAALIFSIYFAAIAIIPAYKSELDWIKIQNIWDRWQTLNASMIALVASLIAFKATTYHYKYDRENNFRAAKAKLGHALNDISTFTNECAAAHKQMYWYAINNTPRERYQNNVISPSRPDEAINIFVECIRYSDANVGRYLAKILEELQIMHARVESIQNTNIIFIPLDISEISNIRYIAETRLKIDNLFSFARNENDFSASESSNSALANTVKFSLNIFDIDIYPNRT